MLRETEFQVMSPIWAARAIARSLLAYYEVDADLKTELELADIVGEELLSIARNFIEDRRLATASGNGRH